MLSNQKSLVFRWSFVASCYFILLMTENSVGRKNQSVRLVKGPNRCSGWLQVRSGQSWSAVCESGFSSENAEVVCRELDCGFHAGKFGMRYQDSPGTTSINELQCKGTEKYLRDCPSLETPTESCETSDAYVSCRERPSEPTVSVYSSQGYDGETAVVFKGHRFTVRCEVGSVLNISSFRLKSGHYIEKPPEQSDASFHQFATFTFPLAEDSHQGTYECDYNYQHIPHIFSTPRNFSIIVKERRDVRLVDGNSRCDGRLEVEREEEWRPVSYKKSWTTKEAAVVCKQLDCGFVLSTTKSDSSTELQPVWRFLSDCDGSESALMACGTVKKWASSSTVHILCSDVLAQPHLSFYSFMSGFVHDQQQEVEIIRGRSFSINCSVDPLYHGGHFGLHINETHIHTQPAVNHSAHFHFPAADHTHQGNFSCVYHAIIFNHSLFAESQSLHLTVRAMEDVTLDDTDSPCAGNVLLGYEEWMLLSAESTVWDLKHASLVCKQTHCGSAVSTKEVKLNSQQLMWRFFSDCDGSESALMDCGAAEPVFSALAVHVTCSGHQGQNTTTERIKLDV